MSRIVELTGKELEKLLSEDALYLNLASRSLHIFPNLNNTNNKELVMNYEGTGYRPSKVTIEFEYDESYNFSESED